MPEFTNSDRNVIGLEEKLWVAVEMLKDHGVNRNAWGLRIEDLRTEMCKIAREIRDYNDQFETEE